MLKIEENIKGDNKNEIQKNTNITIENISSDNKTEKLAAEIELQKNKLNTMLQGKMQKQTKLNQVNE